MASNSIEFYCVDCKKSGSTKNDLSCNKHTICQACLVKRVKTQPQNLLVCLECSKFKEYDPSYSYSDAVLHETPVVTDVTKKLADAPKESEKSDGTLPGIWIFVDDSNIWIEAKKLQSKMKSFKTCEDHRIRIDMGKLADVIADGRPVNQGVLYGSEPPPIDTVWNKIREKGFRVEPQPRSRITGKEKQIDTKLVAEVTSTAIKTPIHERTTIVVVTGDADVIPALKEILKEERWKIEVYMWKQALARALIKYANNNKERVEIKYLDSCLDKVAFTNIRFPISTNVGLKSMVKESGIVFSMTPKAFGNRVPDKAWCKQLESIAQWPFQYYWFQTKGMLTDNLVIVFRQDKKAGKFDCTKFLAAIKTAETNGDSDPKFYLPKVKVAQTFLTFIAKEYKDEPDNILKHLDAALEQVGVYDQDDIYNGYDSDKNCISDSEDKWSTVRLKKRPPRRQYYSELCPFKFNCAFGVKCRYKHTDEEKLDFRMRVDGRGNPLRKVEECKHFADRGCIKPKMECDYAHGVEDAWCLQCCSSGHYTKDCPE